MAKIHIDNLVFAIDQIRIEYISTDTITAGCDLILSDDFDLNLILSDLLALQNQTIHGLSVYDDQDTNKLWENSQDFKLTGVSEQIDFSMLNDPNGHQKGIRLEIC